MNRSFSRFSTTIAFVGSICAVLAGCGAGADPGSTGQSSSALSSGANAVEASSAAECKGALPPLCKTCADGKDECAHWVIEGGKCEVEICPPPAATAPDCDGPLPQECEVCSNGQTDCAHWVVEDGQCVIQICPPAPTPVSSSPSAASGKASATATP